MSSPGAPAPCRSARLSRPTGRRCGRCWSRCSAQVKPCPTTQASPRWRPGPDRGQGRASRWWTHAVAWDRDCWPCWAPSPVRCTASAPSPRCCNHRRHRSCPLSTENPWVEQGLDQPTVLCGWWKLPLHLQKHQPGHPRTDGSAPVAAQQLHDRDLAAAVAEATQQKAAQLRKVCGHGRGHHRNKPDPAERPARYQRSGPCSLACALGFGGTPGDAESP